MHRHVISCTVWRIQCSDGVVSACHSKIYVGAVGNMIVGIACVMTFGICCGIGVDINPISQVVPFLLLGVGVDDMFVIVRTLERIPNHLSTPDRIEQTFRKCGGAIAVTSFTDGLAFLVGATIKFPAMRCFCINAGVGVLLLFILQLTFMAATLALSDQAAKGNPTREFRFFNRLRDLVSGPMVEQVRAGRCTRQHHPASYHHTNTEQFAGPRSRQASSEEEEELPSSFVRDLFAKRLAPFLRDGSGDPCTPL